MTTAVARAEVLARCGYRVTVHIVLISLLVACGRATATSTPEAGPPRLHWTQAEDLAWQALEPNSASHDRANWAVVEARQVLGASVAEEFEDWIFDGACGGPAPQPNRSVDPTETYWYVVMEPQPATPSGPPPVPKGPSKVPEPSIARALFLLDEYGQVIARALTCIVY